MGGHRAALVVKRPSGDQIFVNDTSLAEFYLGRVADAGYQPGMVEDRADVVAAALAAQCDLGAINGGPSHCLGTALCRARGKLPRGAWQALRRLNRAANDAKHCWPEPEAVRAEQYYDGGDDSLEAEQPDRRELAAPGRWADFSPGCTGSEADCKCPNTNTLGVVVGGANSNSKDKEKDEEELAPQQAAQAAAEEAAASKAAEEEAARCAAVTWLAAAAKKVAGEEAAQAAAEAERQKQEDEPAAKKAADEEVARAAAVKRDKEAAANMAAEEEAARCAAAAQSADEEKVAQAAAEDERAGEERAAQAAAEDEHQKLEADARLAAAGEQMSSEGEEGELHEDVGDGDAEYAMSSEGEDFELQEDAAYGEEAPPGDASGTDLSDDGDEGEMLMAAYAANYQRLYDQFRAEGRDDSQAARYASWHCDEIAEEAAQALRDG